MAFPRAAAMAFWGWLLGSGMLIAAYAINGGPGGGRAKAVDLSFVAMAFILASLCVASVCLLTTIFALRTSGLWMSPRAHVLVVDRRGLQPVAVHPPGAAGQRGARSTSTTTTAPAPPWARRSGASWPGPSANRPIYVVAIPVLGAVTDILATLSGTRLAHRGVVMAAIGAFGVLAFGAWAQPTFAPDIESEALYVAMGVLAVLPVLVLLGGWATTLRGGKPVLKSPLLFALSSAVVLLLAVIGGAVYVIRALELHNQAWFDNSLVTPPYATGQALLVVGAAAIAALGALVYWSPKIFGRFANDGLAKLAALVGLVGALIAGLPLMIFGFAIKADALADSGKFLNGLSAFGVVVLLLAVVLVVAALVVGTKGDDIADDAWGVGQSLEWATASPPAPGNFGVLARVESPEPVLDRLELGGCSLMAATVTTEPSASPAHVEPSGPVPPPPVERPRVLLVGTAFARGRRRHAVRRADRHLPGPAQRHDHQRGQLAADRHDHPADPAQHGLRHPGDLGGHDAVGRRRRSRTTTAPTPTSPSA